MKILALDFDGVVSDSIWDGLFTAYNTYLKFNPDTKIFGGVQLTFDNFNKIKAENKDALERFKLLTTFAIGAKHYIVAFYIMKNNEDIKNLEEFKDYCDRLDKNKLELFQKEFYVERKRLQELDLDKWYNLSPPFKDIIPPFNKLLEKDNAFIVTSKDKDAIIKLGSKYGLKIDETKIIDKDIGLDKADKLEILSKKYKVGKSDVFLVDDLLAHLLNIKEKGFNGFMATWGYNNEKQQREAQKKGITLLTPDDFYEKIKDKNVV